ncbi:MAG: sugar ABC transporter permease [Actinobacteria bacterium]|nr:sugar ABC transporter permease [Actinomycetota bacterium]
MKRFFEKNFYILLTIPATVMIAFISIYPAFYSFALSLNKLTNAVGKFEYVGLKNYVRLFRNPDFLSSGIVSLKYISISLVGTIFLGLILALLLNKKVKFKGTFMSIFLIPWIISEVVSGNMFRWLFDGSFSIINEMLSEAGLPALKLLNNPDGALAIVNTATIWRNLGFAMIIFIAALQTIDPNVIEAAKVDGAGGWQQFRFITFPLIRYHFMVVLILLTLFFINQVTTVFVITRGGPVDSTLVPGMFLYRLAFNYFDLGQASAFSVFLFVVNIIVISFYIRLLMRPQ